MTTTEPVDTFRADRSPMTRAMARGHIMRTGHELTGYYVPTADAGIVRLIRTCSCGDQHDS